MNLRARLKRHAPDAAVAAVRRCREALQSPPLEDSVLGAYRFTPDSGDAPRINLVAPSLDPAVAFGGLNTCVEYMLRLLAALRAERPRAELRFLTERSRPLEATAVPGIAHAAGLPLDGVTVRAAPLEADVPTRASDLFIAYNWWTALNIQPVIEAQTARYGGPKRQRIYFLQDYEPHFYSFSGAHLMARAALDLDWPLWLICNTTELAAYVERMGHRAERLHAFEPRLTPAMRPFVEDLEQATRRRRVLAYARPSVPRNCFSLLRQTLRIWSERSESHGWEAVSAGADHPPVSLAGGRSLRPLGKLPLGDYAQTLRETAVGLSFMASPHPSYPPIEMAHFGVRVVTNDFADKDLSRRHENILSVRDGRPEAMADALASACAAFDRDPTRGPLGVSHMPDFLSSGFDNLDAVARGALDLWGTITP